MATVDLQNRYRLAPGHRLQWEEAQQAWVILYPEGMIRLNDSAADVLRRCDGQKPLRAVVAEVESDYEQAGLGDDILALVDAALADGWLCIERE